MLNRFTYFTKLNQFTKLKYNHLLNKNISKTFFNFGSKKSKNNSDEESEITEADYEQLKDHYLELSKKHDTYKAKLDELESALDQSLEDSKRILERHEREILNQSEFGHSKLAKDVLDSADNFVRALQSLPEKPFETLDDLEKNQIYHILKEGIELTKESFNNTLKRYGIVEYNPIKERFDADKHEKIKDVESQIHAPGVISEVIETGFKYHNTVLRKPKVGVSIINRINLNTFNFKL